jgi:hypothetical protein
MAAPAESEQPTLIRRFPIGPSASSRPDAAGGWNTSTASEHDLNRLAVFLGASAQSNADEDASAMHESDLLTGEHLGRRVAEHARLLRRAHSYA